MSYERDEDYRELSLEAMEILSNSRLKKADRDRLREIIRAICKSHGDTDVELRTLELAGLNGRDKQKLARLQSLHARVVNVQVCSECKPYFETLLEEGKYV